MEQIIATGIILVTGKYYKRMQFKTNTTDVRYLVGFMISSVTKFRLNLKKETSSGGNNEGSWCRQRFLTSRRTHINHYRRPGATGPVSASPFQNHCGNFLFFLNKRKGSVHVRNEEDAAPEGRLLPLARAITPGMMMRTRANILMKVKAT